MTPAAQAFLETVYQGLTRYHRHRVEGLERFPRTGPVMLALNHSFASYDILLVAGAIYEGTGRVPRALGDRLIFKVPGLRDLAKVAGIVAGAPDAAHNSLQAGHVVMVAPGGMREALRPHQQRYKLLWQRRLGFARAALRAGAPVVLAACPRADDIYRLYESRLTKWAYANFRVPVPVLRGLGPTLLPRPVSLVHHLSEPIHAPAPLAGEGEEERVARFHSLLVDRMETLMQGAV